MILWLALLILVLALSFVLAARSMRDFQQFPSVGDYGLFLIRNLKNLNSELLISITNSLKSGQVLSLERLFKGSEAALVVFGPRKLLAGYSSLNLLELEDYTNITQPFSATLVGIKNSANWEKIALRLPKLESSEQFWWQVSFSRHFKAQIKAVLLSFDDGKRAGLSDILQNLVPGKLSMLPKDLSDDQILEAYQKRIFLGSKVLSLNAEEILQLLFI